MRVLRHRAFGPGETVELPLSEIERFKRLGFLVDDNFTYPAGPAANVDHTVDQKPLPAEQGVDLPRR